MKYWRAAMNQFGRSRTPFFFLLDFELQRPRVILIDEVEAEGIQFSFHEVRPREVTSAVRIAIDEPFPKDQYDDGFQRVYHSLSRGDSYLTNYTVRHKVSLQGSLEQIFHASSAPYKLLDRKRNFVVFSPECFVRTRGDRIFTYPMKGTIDASLDDAENRLLNDTKELAEHVTIVDLMRNDIGQVAQRVRVDRFRYLEKIKTQSGEVWQTSSEISGEMNSGWRDHVGDIFHKLLPAGSVSGAPKRKTCEIIREAEPEPRGYYCGVMGFFDGHNIDSAVLIRYIEKTRDGFFYRSGGGITLGSDCSREYEETLIKVYVPVV